MPGKRAGRFRGLITHSIFRQAAFGRNHPLSISRHGTVLDLCETLGWLSPEATHHCTLAQREVLEGFHRADYLDAFERTAKSGRADARDREIYNLGTMECPLFDGLWERARATVGGAILAARLVSEGGTIFHPGGGTHHGRPDRASGFCYLNDPVFAILELLAQGLKRVLYVDLDAHHGDGVQDGLAGEARVRTISVHEDGRWPYTGALADRAGGRALNLPVARRINDSEFAHVMSAAVLPAAQLWAPDAIVITCGADGLAGDPLSSMELSNVALWGAVENLAALSPRTIVLGGGGYNPWTTARAWTGLFARLSGRELPYRIPEPGRALLRSLQCDLVDDDEFEARWLTHIDDLANPGEVREPIRAAANFAASELENFVQGRL